MTGRGRARRGTGGAVALVAAVAGLTIAPAAASAGTLSATGNQVTFVAGPGEANNVTTSGYVDTPMINFGDARPITLAPGGPCVYHNGDTSSVDCPLTGPASYDVQLGDGNDRATINSQGTTNAVDGGPGDDDISLNVPGGRNTISGGEGDDTLYPDRGSSGYPVNPPASDTISGGGGTDLVDYEGDYGGHASGLVISLDGTANDGSPGEQDNVRPDVENVSGTSRAEKITGSAGPNKIMGQGGDDVLSGGGGNDQLFGGTENDNLSGGAGNDYLEGGSEDDKLVGGPGFDSFVGDFSGSVNQIVVGNDTILARDGVSKEPISCGPGSDSAVVDVGDNVNADPQNLCESVSRGRVRPGVRLASRTLSADRRGRVAFRFRATPSSAKATLRLTAKVAARRRGHRVSRTILLARGSFRVGADGRVSRRATLTRAGSRALRPGRTVRAVLRISLAGKTFSTRVKVKRARR